MEYKKSFSKQQRKKEIRNSILGAIAAAGLVVIVGVPFCKGLVKGIPNPENQIMREGCYGVIEQKENYTQISTRSGFSGNRNLDGSYDHLRDVIGLISSDDKLHQAFAQEELEKEYQCETR